jgi:DNA-binding CsgD family transcriptional regulator
LFLILFDGVSMETVEEQSIAQVLGPGDALALLEFIDACLKCESTERLAFLIDRYLNLLLNFDHATYLSVNQYNGMTFEPLNISYPQQFLDIYQQCGFAPNDPIFNAVFNQPGVNYWADLLNGSEVDKKLTALVNDFNLIDGYESNIRSQSHNRLGMMSICGRKVERSERTETIMRLMLPHIHQAFARVRATSRAQGIKLTGRENEILNWVQTGKTSWEISSILKISERTVRFHLANVMKKLDATSRTHAVAVALDLGLIAHG